jgi:hypothetical protein
MRLSIIGLVILISHLAFSQQHFLDNRKYFQFRDTSFEAGEVKILTPYIYDSGEPSSLDSLEIFLYYHPELKVEVGSHTDSKGKDKYNLRLSQARAQSIVDYLISKGISSDRLSAKGYGETLFIAPNETPYGKDYPVGRQLNRRTEIKITSIAPAKENFFRPTLLNPQLPFIHFLFGENSSAFTLSLFSVRAIENVIDSDNKLGSSFLAQYKSCARSYVGFIDAAGDSLVMAAINFSPLPRTKKNSLFDSNDLSKTRVLFINLSKRICLKSF